MELTEREMSAAPVDWFQRARWWAGSRLWDRRAPKWEEEGAAGLQSVIDAVVEAAGAGPGTVTIDLGCGSGQLSVPLAKQGAHVTAVDISSRMVELVRERAAQEHLEHLSATVSPIERLVLPPASVDLVVTNYVLHHLRDADKAAVVRAAATWLRPGGQLVVGDMMFGRGRTDRDREIIKSKVATMLGRGPGGWWRLTKNVFRFTLRLRERPVSMDTWVRYFESAGLVGVAPRSVVAEAGIVVGRKP